MTTADEHVNSYIQNYLEEDDLFRTYAHDPDAHKRVKFIKELFAEV